MKCLAVSLMTIGLLFVGSRAQAVDLGERCAEDQLNSAQTSNGRNQWALSCHLITKIDYDCAVNNGYYWTFNSTTGGTNVAPTHPGMSCAGYRKFTMCPAGCFEARQRVSFGGSYMTPESAFAAQQSTVTVLDASATLAHLAYTETAIGRYVRGEEHRDLIKIVAHDRSIVVTHTHPMVDSRGTLVPAESVVAGSVLLMSDGPAAVTFVDRVPYDGMVWNMRPVKADPKANIVVAEGFLTGSIRYQNEWASDTARLLLRQSLEVDSL